MSIFTDFRNDLVDWRGPRVNERFWYMRSTFTIPGTPHESDELGNITGGRISLSLGTDVKASCTFDFVGGQPPRTDEAVAIFYSFSDLAGNIGLVYLGRYAVEYSSVNYINSNGTLVASGTVSGSAFTKMYADRKTNYPRSWKAGAGIVASVIDMAPVNMLDVSITGDLGNLKSRYTADAGASYMSIVNDLLAKGGYSSLYMHPDGGVTSVPSRAYVEADAFTFSNDSQSVIRAGGVEVENDLTSNPNAVRLMHTDNDRGWTVWAYARNTDPDHPASIPNRGGREVTLFEEVRDLAGTTKAVQLDNLKAKALTRLKQNSLQYRYTTVNHPIMLNPSSTDNKVIRGGKGGGVEQYVNPLWIGDSVHVDYTAADGTKLTRRGLVYSMDIGLSTSTPCTTRVRGVVGSSSLTVTQGGGTF